MSIALSAIQAVLNVAWSLRWVTETNGSNRGEAVDAIVRVTGLDPATRSPWCACFVAYAGYSTLKDQWPLKKVAGCVSLHDDAQAKGLLVSSPQPGDIFLLFGKAGDGVERFHHCGFVTGPGTTPGTWATVEGNTNVDGSPDGTGVFVRQRTFGPKDAFIRWAA